MAFSLSNITGKGYSGSGSGTITIPPSTVGDIAILITCNGNSEDNSTYIPTIPSDFIRVGITTNGRTVYTKKLVSGDMGRSISVTGPSSWGWIYFTVPSGWRLIQVISTTTASINFNSKGSGVAIVSDLVSSTNDNGYACVNSSYGSELLYMKEFASGTSFPVPQGSSWHNTNYPHLVFQISSSSNYNYYKYGSLGQLDFYNSYDMLTMSGANSAYGSYATASDVLVGNKYIYIVDCDMNMVYVYNKNSDGTIGTKVKNVNWYSQDTTIDVICRNASSVPTAYAVFVENGNDKLVGWSYASAVLYVWDIIDGNISGRASYPAPTTMTYYSRGGWDGGHYVYFVDRGTGMLYRWDIRNKGTQPAAVRTLAGFTTYATSSFTGSGLFVDVNANEVYASSGANQNDGFLTCWDLTTGVRKGTLTAYNQFCQTCLSSTTGSIILNPTNRNVAYYIAMYQSNVVELRLSYASSEYFSISYSLFIDGKYYIPSKEFYDITKKEFIPVTLDFLKDYKNNFYKFVHNPENLNRRVHFNNETFLPFEKLDMTNAKILKMYVDDSDWINSAALYDNVYMQNYDQTILYDCNSLVFSYNTYGYHLTNSTIVFEGFTQSDNYSYNFIDIGFKPNVKVLIKSDGKYYGVDLKETTPGRILMDGINGNDLGNYSIKFLNFDICIAFKNKCYTDLEKLTKIRYYTKQFQNMKKFTDYTAYHDTEKDKIYIKFSKDFNNILVKKLDNTDLDFENKLEAF